ncbi:MAG: GNAT family N-acetyltransferase [Gemmatimonadota bacterium]
MSEPQFDFRPLEEADLPMLREWLGRPHLCEWWGPERTLDELRETYLPRIAGEDTARPFVATVDGDSVGYIQWYRAGAVPGWWPDDPGPDVIGIDLFVADGARLDQGLGTSMVSRFVRLLFQDPEVTEVRVDPHPDNGRAIRCYEKAGFERIDEITTPDGPALMMRLRRAATR